MNCDPIGIGDSVNVYAYCKGNPIKNIDKTGNQTTTEPTVKELVLNVYFHQDKAMGDLEFSDYIKKFEENAVSFWSGREYKDTDGKITKIVPKFTFQVSEKSYSEMSHKEKKALGKDAIVFNVQTYGVSRNEGNSGAINIRETSANTAGHEIGHSFGLKDRYQHFKDQNLLYSKYNSQTLAIRQTEEGGSIPMALSPDHPDFKDYKPYNNAYFRPDSRTLTNWQLGVVLGINVEKQEPQVVISGLPAAPEGETENPNELRSFLLKGISIRVVNNGSTFKVLQYTPDGKEYHGLNKNQFHWSGYKNGVYVNQEHSPSIMLIQVYKKTIKMQLTRFSIQKSMKNKKIERALKY